MPSATPEERRRKIKEKQARLNAELQRMDTRARQADRKRDTRRKFLAGALVLEMIARGELAEAEVMAALDRFLKLPCDRAMFDLLPDPCQRLRALRAAGHSQRAIAQILEAEGVHPGRYKKWNRETVRRILARADAAAATEEVQDGQPQ